MIKPIYSGAVDVRAMEEYWKGDPKTWDTSTGKKHSPHAVAATLIENVTNNPNESKELVKGIKGNESGIYGGLPAVRAVIEAGRDWAEEMAKREVDENPPTEGRSHWARTADEKGPVQPIDPNVAGKILKYIDELPGQIVADPEPDRIQIAK